MNLGFHSAHPDASHRRGRPPSYRLIELGDPLPVVFGRTRSSERGLSSAEARNRWLDGGPNDPAIRRQGAVAREFLGFLANPLVIILLIASLVSAILGETVNAAIIVVMVVLSVILNF